MNALYIKEIKSFFSSLIGYVTIFVFLLMCGLFMWVFPGDLNQLDRGYADLDTLFFVAPWIFLFLIPAITMRSFSEEKRTGTIELLLTRPLTDLQIIGSKFLAGCTIVFFALLPTLIYYFSMKNLANPIGNIDTGGITGSYIGLLLLAMAFVAIGIFASSLSDNQVVAFIIGMLFCFIFLAGFEMIASFDLMGSLDDFFINLGLNQHYQSLSRGVVDTRDVIYMLGISAVFLAMTRFTLSSRTW